LPKILLVGNDGSVTVPSGGAGACIARTERFRIALENAGFEVHVCSVDSSLSSVSVILEALRKTVYSCLVAISPYPAELAVRTGTEIPMWIDMNGMHPAEIHISGKQVDKPRLEMIRILALENALLARGDFFSAPSSRQTHAILGELYLLGRLDSCCRYLAPVKSIPHCAVEAPQSTGPIQGSSEFSVISTGSFNSWFDGITLFDALEFAMIRNPNITFTATGGAVPFAEEQYNLFLRKLSFSELKNRFRIAGWVNREELEGIQRTASVAVYTDIPSGETCLGARTRVLDWISRGIPVICTAGAEISETISGEGMGISVSPQNPEQLGEAILKLAAEPETIDRIKRAQALWRNGAGSMESVFKPLIDWCSNPGILPGKQLCDSTVPAVSSKGYRKMVLKEIALSRGKTAAWNSFTAKIRHSEN
jgi:glycosyltransferase involved in cell wall biosynthesis